MDAIVHTTLCPREGSGPLPEIKYQTDAVVEAAIPVGQIYSTPL